MLVSDGARSSQREFFDTQGAVEIAYCVLRGGGRQVLPRDFCQDAVELPATQPAGFTFALYVNLRQQRVQARKRFPHRLARISWHNRQLFDAINYWTLVPGILPP